MRIFSLVNQKGGCGKTTVAINLAGALAERGRRVLVVDLDPQAHATLGLGGDGEGLSLLEVLNGTASPRAALVAAAGGITLLPAHARLAEFEEAAARMIRPESLLCLALQEIAPDFDDALLDCPARADGVLTANALYASTVALLVVETGAFALQGALKALELVNEIAASQGASFDVRVLGTLFDRRTRFARELLVALHARFGADMFETVIRASVRLREAAGRGVPVQVLDPRSRAAGDFSALSAELCALVPRTGRELAPELEWEPAAAPLPRAPAAPRSGRSLPASGIRRERA